MKKNKILAFLTVAALSTGIFAQQGGAPAPGFKADSVIVEQQVSKSALNKQASIQRPTKKTNWSKIKTMFE